MVSGALSDVSERSRGYPFLCQAFMPPFKLLTLVKPASTNTSTATNDIPPPGQRVTISTGYYYRFNRDTQYLWAHLIYRQFGRVKREQDLLLVREEKNSTGFQFELNVDCRIFPYYKGGISLLADGRIHGKDELHQIYVI